METPRIAAWSRYSNVRGKLQTFAQEARGVAGMSQWSRGRCALLLFCVRFTAISSPFPARAYRQRTGVHLQYVVGCPWPAKVDV
jgi:hypothetical protein